jgi:hypothetical protein
MSGRRLLDLILAVAIVVNLMLALVGRDWGQAIAWFVAGTCLVQAWLWRATADSWRAVCRHGRT